ncbi:GNAT family N-acetyltransferase [Primorskyibacter sp. 2E107]|uniref:GNAT family N-acetyltransferase n=1 Tax=Primorskyibacter sp. 2E107 TaxID=3403458 RepID=UPI003AF4EAFF
MRRTAPRTPAPTANSCAPPRATAARCPAQSASNADFGFRLARAARRQGIATEAGAALFAHHCGSGPMPPPLRTSHHVGNPRSAGVLRKRGFAITGEGGPVTPLSTGKPVPLVLLTLSREAWENAPVYEI